MSLTWPPRANRRPGDNTNKCKLTARHPTAYTLRTPYTDTVHPVVHPAVCHSVHCFILFGFVAWSPVGVWWPLSTHPRPMAEGIMDNSATKQPLRHRLRRWLVDGSTSHLATRRGTPAVHLPYTDQYTPRWRTPVVQCWTLVNSWRFTLVWDILATLTKTGH